VRIGVINYGMGNLASVKRAFEDLGALPFVASHPAALFEADRIVLPGVGSFREGMERLRAGGWIEPLQRLVVEDGRCLLGICLGMQMLMSSGEEGGGSAGLAFIHGNVRRLDAIGCRLRIPHVGWNDVSTRADEPLFGNIPQGSDFYFVHSYAVEVSNGAHVVGTTTYGVEVVAAVRAGHILGTQFHPEKSSRSGRQVLKNFLDLRAC